MPKIHPTAVVEPGAELAEDAEVGPFCYVSPKATLGTGTRLVSHVAIHGRTTLGVHNTVWSHASLGGQPQDLKYRGEDSELVIGDHNDIRENVTIHRGTANDQGVTRLGDHNLIMVGVHIGHDCVLGSHIVIANAVQLAGHVLVEDHANLGGATAAHHFVTIGQFSYVGGMTRLVHDVPPFMLVEGNPARVRKVNTVLLARHHFPEAQVEHLKDAYRRLFRGGRRTEDLPPPTVAAALDALEARYPDDPSIATLVASLRRSSAGVYGRFRESQRRDNRYKNPIR